MVHDWQTIYNSPSILSRKYLNRGSPSKCKPVLNYVLASIYAKLHFNVLKVSLLPFAFNREAWTFFRACLFFKRDSFPDNRVDWTNENVSFGARNYACLSKKCGTFCSRGVQVSQIKHIFQGLHRTSSDTFTSASRSLVQIKVIYDYYSSKRVTPFFIGEEELLEYDFEAFKERLVREVPHLATSCNNEWRKKRGRLISSIFYVSVQGNAVESKKHHLKSICIRIAISWGSQVWGTNESATHSAKTSTSYRAVRRLRSIRALIYDGKNPGRLTIKNSVKVLLCTHQENLKTTLINNRHLSATSQKQRSKLTKNKKLLSALKTKNTKN